MNKTPVAKAAAKALERKPPQEQYIAYPLSFLNAIATYLNTRPHGEVRGFIDATQSFSAANIGVTPTAGGANTVPVIVLGGAWVIG